MLTKGLDNVPGTSGNDTIIGSITAVGGTTELDTLATLDIVNGGAGIDTLKIATSIAAAGTPGLPNLSNVEIIEVEATAGVTIDTSAVAGVTDLKITKQGAGLIDATAAATTDIAVTVKEDDAGVAAALANVIKGGKNVTVTATDLGGATAGGTPDTITIGGAGALAAAGDVVVNATGAASVAGAAKTLSAITVTGGKTISVTQKATSDAAAAAADGTGATIDQGAVIITGNAATTTVTVKQDADVAEVTALPAIAAKATTEEVVFSAAKKGDVVTIDFGAGSLAFTANKDLTAAEVASAFANLATGAKQGNASAALGIYKDANADAGATTTTGVSDGWTSGAVQTVSATQSKVVFSSNTVAADLTATATPVAGSTFTAADQGRVAGTAAQAARTGVLGVDNGAVTIKDSAATGTIKTITVDGYATGSRIGGVGGTDNTTSLETLNLANAEGAATMTVDDTAATLALTIEKLGSSVTNATTGVVTVTDAALDLAAAPTTLNVKSVGNNYIDLDAVATETLNVSGTGTLKADEVNANELNGLKTIKVTETAGLNLALNAGSTNNITSVDTTGSTGTTTVSIKGDAATYTGGAGVDNVTVTNANTAVAKAIDLGAGNDTLTLNVTAGTVAVPTVELKGGDGDDTIVMSAADAIALSANATFEAKMSGFEKLSIGAYNSTTAATVNLANMDDISYVLSANSAGTAAGAKAVYAGAVPGLTQNDTIKFTYKGGAELTAAIGATGGATATAAEVQTAINTALVGAGAGYANGDVVASFSGNDLVLTAAGNVVTDTLTGGAYADVDGAVPDRSVADATDTASTLVPAYAVYGGAATYMTTNDTIKFTYAGGAELTATIGVTGGATATAAEVQTAINTALVAGGYAAGDVVASFTGVGSADLTLTAHDSRALIGGAYADLDDTEGSAAGSVADATDTAAAGAAAKAVYAGAVAGLTKNDTIKFTYAGGAELTATIGVTGGATATAAEVQTAINTALVAGGYAAGDVVASFTGVGSADLTLTAHDTRALVGGAYADVDGAVADRSVADATDTAAGAEVPSLTIDNMASNGTLELTAGAAGDAGVTVLVKDATTGLTDVLNIVTSAATNANLGTVEVDKVETLYVKANDTDALKILGVDNVSTNTLKLDADAATTINLSGAGNLTLTLSTDTKAVTLVDGSTATGKLNVTAVKTTAENLVIKGGLAADTLTSAGQNDKLFGNEGNDKLVASGTIALVELNGGTGIDQYDVSGAASKTAASVVRVTLLENGETIKFQSNTQLGGTGADQANFNSTKFELTAGAGLESYVGQALAAATTYATAGNGGVAAQGGVAWFQQGGNTYIVQDVDGNSAFSTNDIVVELVGLYDLSKSSFNEDGQGTMQFIA